MKNNPGKSLCDLGLGALLLFLVLLFYLPAINGDFLFDDDRYVTPAHLQSLSGLFEFWFRVGRDYHYFPVLYSFFWVEHRLWGDVPFWYHLTGLLMHIGCAWLLVALLRRLSVPGAWLAGFIFALHPVCVESVAWISEQKNTLSTLLCFSAALFYLRFDRDRGKWGYLLAGVLFVLGLLTKTTVATLPPALLVIFWWQRGRIDWKRDVLPLIPWFAVTIIGGVVSSRVEAVSADYHYPLNLLERCLLASRVICFYLGKLFWPTGLIFNYPLWNISASQGELYLYLAGVLLLLVFLCLVARRHRGPLAGFLYFAGTLFPVLGFLYLGWFSFSYVADHFQYLSMPGIIAPVACGFTLATRRISVRWASRVPGVVLVLVLASLTWRQAFVYRDMQSLYDTTLRLNPGSTMAHFNRGIILLKIPGRLTEALAEFRTAAELSPGDVKLLNDTGYILMTIEGGSHMSEAIACFEQALQINPNSGPAHYFLGNALQNFPDRIQEAIVHEKMAVELQPDFAEARCAYGNALAKAPGRTQEAIEQYEEAVRLKPDFAEAHYALGVTLGNMQGREAEAAGHYEKAIKLRPEFVEAEYNFGCLLARMPGRSEEAIVHLEAALRIMPDLDQAQVLIDELRDAPKNKQR